MHQRDAQRAPGQAQRDILTRSLGDLQRLLDVAQRGVVGQQHPARYRGTVGVCDDDGMRHRVGAAGHGQRPVEVVAPPRTAQRPSGGAARGQRQRQRRPEDEVAFGGVAVGQVDDGLRPAQRLGHLAGLKLRWRSPRGTARPSSVGSPIDSTSAMVSEASRDASRTRPCIMCSPQQPGHADGQRRLVPGRRAQLSQLLEEAAGDVGMDPEGVAAQQGARRDAHRGAVRVVGGQRVGDPARPLPTQPTPPTMSRVAAHAPARMCQPIGGVQIAGGLQVLGDQARHSRRADPALALFDRGGHPPMQLERDRT